MTSVFTLEDFQNLVRNDFKDKEIKPLIEALENLLIDSDEFTKDDFVLCCNGAVHFFLDSPFVFLRNG